MKTLPNRRTFLQGIGALAGSIATTKLWLPHTARGASTIDGVFYNPILRGNYADPTIVRVEDTYYMTHYPANYSPALLIWKSRTLVDWEPVGYALPKYGGGISAPDLSYHQGRFYIYYETRGSNRVIVADRIEGPWSKPVDLHLPHIDPFPIVTPEGKRYLHLSGGMAACATGI